MPVRKNRTPLARSGLFPNSEPPSRRGRTGEGASLRSLPKPRHGKQEEVEAEQEQEEAQNQRRPGPGPRLRPRVGATGAAATGTLGGPRRRLPAGPGYARGRRAV